jgi:Cu-Zn family superoxide dismutase
MKLEGADSVVGRAIIIHANPDDFTQPTGNAGGRIATGVIGLANPAN